MNESLKALMESYPSAPMTMIMRKLKVSSQEAKSLKNEYFKPNVMPEIKKRRRKKS